MFEDWNEPSNATARRNCSCSVRAGLEHRGARTRLLKRREATKPRIAMLVLASFFMLGCERSIQEYPSTYPGLKTLNDDCSDISGYYKSDYRLLDTIMFPKTQSSFIESPDFHGQVPEFLELILSDGKYLKFTFSNNGSELYSGMLTEGDEYHCNDGSVRIDMGYVLKNYTPGTLLREKFRFFFYKTAEGDLVAKGVKTTTPIMLLIPIPGAGRQEKWLRWKSAGK